MLYWFTPSFIVNRHKALRSLITSSTNACLLQCNCLPLICCFLSNKTNVPPYPVFTLTSGTVVIRVYSGSTWCTYFIFGSTDWNPPPSIQTLFPHLPQTLGTWCIFRAPARKTPNSAHFVPVPTNRRPLSLSAPAAAQPPLVAILRCIVERRRRRRRLRDLAPCVYTHLMIAAARRRYNEWWTVSRDGGSGTSWSSASRLFPPALSSLPWTQSCWCR